MTLEELFTSIGYTKSEYEKMRNSHSLKNVTNQTLLEKTKEVYIWLKNQNYSDSEIIKMTKNLPSLYTLNIDSLNQKKEKFLSLGYKQEQIIKMAKKHSAIYSLNTESIQKKFEDLLSYGYKEEEIIKMTANFPLLYCMSLNSINEKWELLLNSGYQKHEILEMTKSLPAVYGSSIESLKEKIDFYDSIGLHELPILKPKELIQSISLSYARYRYYLSKGIEINIDNYSRLFMTEKTFQKRYNIAKQDILKLYNYEEAKQKKNQKM